MSYPEVIKGTKTLLKAKITALGCYIPPRVLTNQDLEKMVETNDQWIMTRIGIPSATSRPRTWRLPIWRSHAAQCALAQRGIDATELDAIIVCTVTPDMMFPSTACLVQNSLGAHKAPGDST